MDTNCSRARAKNSCTDGISRRAAFGSLVSGAAALPTVWRNHAQAQATPTPRGEAGEAPNQFVLDGAETRLTCDLTTLAGGPRLTYDGPYGSQTLAGETLRAEESSLGLLVTGYLGAFPDQGELWLTLLLPSFNGMTAEDEPAPFATLAILKWRVSTIAGPPRTGALEEYRVLPVEGAAQFIVT